MISRIAAQVFLSRAQRQLIRRGVPVFTYHRLGAPPAGSRDPFLYVRPEQLDAHLRALATAGYTTGTLADIRTAADNQDRRFVVTFDDAVAGIAEQAMPVLARHGARAITFVVANLIGQRNEWDIAQRDVAERLMDISQIRDWLAAGHEIGSHTLRHANLTRLSRTEAWQEIQDSKKSLEDTFSVAVPHFCYPFGEWNEALGKMVAEAGYQTACTVEFGVNTAQTCPWQLKRIIPLVGTEWCRKAYHRLRRKLGG